MYNTYIHFDICCSLQWRYNGRVGVSNHQPHGCLLNRLFGRRKEKTSTLRDDGLCAGNSPVTGEFPAQMASNAENVSVWYHHIVLLLRKAIMYATNILRKCYFD